MQSIQVQRDSDKEKQQNLHPNVSLYSDTRSWYQYPQVCSGLFQTFHSSKSQLKRFFETVIVSETEVVALEDNSTVLVENFAFQLTPLRLDPLYIRWEDSWDCFIIFYSIEFEVPRKNISFLAPLLRTLVAYINFNNFLWSLHGSELWV